MKISKSYVFQTLILRMVVKKVYKFSLQISTSNLLNNKIMFNNAWKHFMSIMYIFRIERNFCVVMNSDPCFQELLK